MAKQRILKAKQRIDFASKHTTSHDMVTTPQFTEASPSFLAYAFGRQYANIMHIFHIVT